MELELRNVHAAYGLAEILRGVTLQVQEGGTTILLGRNGMGKTSLLRCVMGLPTPATTSGMVLLGGHDITGLPPHARARRGIGYVPQGRRIFESLTVAENLTLAARHSTNGATNWTMADVVELFPRLQGRARQLGGTLSGGEQQMLAVGRGLMTNPSTLLLDEPSEGLAPLIVAELTETLTSLRDVGITILMAEQNLAVAERMGDDVLIIERGEIVLADRVEAFVANRDAKQRYLGVG